MFIYSMFTLEHKKNIQAKCMWFQSSCVLIVFNEQETLTTNVLFYHHTLNLRSLFVIYRYLHKNVDQTHGRRGEVKRLKDQLTVLQQRLEGYIEKRHVCNNIQTNSPNILEYHSDAFYCYVYRYKNYGSGPAKYPLADMLQYVLEFATTKPTNVSPGSPVPINPSVPTEPSSGDTRQGPMPSTVSCVMITSAVYERTLCLFICVCFALWLCLMSCCSQTEPDDTGPSDGLQTATQRTPIHKPFTQCRPSLDVPLQPAPHSVTEEELHFVRGCLQRWRAEVENTINGRFFVFIARRSQIKRYINYTINYTFVHSRKVLEFRLKTCQLWYVDQSKFSLISKVARLWNDNHNLPNAEITQLLFDQL